MNFELGKALLFLLFYYDNPYFFIIFSKFLSLLFHYFFVEEHLKACCRFSQICNRAMALDWCQIFISSQYLENKWIEFHQIMYAFILGSAVAQRQSAWLETERPWVRASLASLRCVLEQDTLILSVMVQPRKTRPYIIERMLMGRKVSNQTNKFAFILTRSTLGLLHDNFGTFVTVMALDWCQNFVSAQYFEIKWTEFHQILYMHLYWQDLHWDCYLSFFTHL